MLLLTLNNIIFLQKQIFFPKIILLNFFHSQKEMRWDECPVVVEISPLVSYAGEGLDKLVANKKFTCPLSLSEPAKKIEA